MITHEPGLVLLSITIAVLGTFTASVMTPNIRFLAPGQGTMRIVMASLTLGGAVWATQFVGLLAIQVPVNFAYNPALSGASAAIALFGTAIALFLLKPNNPRAKGRMPVALAIFGLTILSTNALCIFAVAGRGVHFSWFLASICAVFSMYTALTVLWFLYRPRGVIVTFLGATAVGLLVAAVHYLAIAPVQGLEEALLLAPPNTTGISERYLAWAATIMIYLLCSICLSVFLIMQFREDIE